MFFWEQIRLPAKVETQNFASLRWLFRRRKNVKNFSWQSTNDDCAESPRFFYPGPVLPQPSGDQSWGGRPFGKSAAVTPKSAAVTPNDDSRPMAQVKMSRSSSLSLAQAQVS